VAIVSSLMVLEVQYMNMLINIMVVTWKRGSTTRYVFTLAGGVLSWMSKLHEKIYFPTSEA